MNKINILTLSLLASLSHQNSWGMENNANIGDIVTSMDTSKQQTQTTTTTKQVSGIPRVPQFELLTDGALHELITNAKQGDEIAFKSLLKRIFWGNTKNPFTHDELSNISGIYDKIKTPKGYLYWHLIFMCDGFIHFPDLPEIIEDHAKKDNDANAQYIWGNMNFFGFSEKYDMGCWLLDQAISTMMFYGKKLSMWPDKKSIKFYRLAAENGHPLAQYTLGNMYVHNIGALFQMRDHCDGYGGYGYKTWNDIIKFNYNKSRKYLNLAAEQEYFGPIFLFQLPKAQRIKPFLENYGNCTTVIEGRKIDFLQLFLDSDNSDAHYYIRDILKYNYNYEYKYEANANILQLEHELRESLQQDYTKHLSPLQEISTAMQGWLDIFPPLCEHLKEIEPGFMINCVELNINFNTLHNSNYISQYRHNNQCVTIGEKNNKIARRLIKFLDSRPLIQLTADIEGISETNSKNKKSYEKKIRQLWDEKSVLEQFKQSTDLPENEKLLLPQQLAEVNLNLRKYEIMVKNETLMQDLIISWDKNAYKFGDRLINDGIAERNAAFLVKYPFLAR